jgi:hypothetical protein
VTTGLGMPGEAPLNLVLRPEDFGPGDRGPKAQAAARRVTPFSARDSNTAFEDCYRALHAEFAPRGEMETMDDLKWELAGRPHDDRYEIRYEFLGFRDGDALAGVRDAYVVSFRRAPFVVVVLAHALVLPPWRRSGLGAVLRAVPAALGRAVLGDRRLLLMCETDPLDPDDPGSAIRLAAYQRGGFQWLDPARVPYAQPDFGPWRAEGRDPRPVPLLVGFREVGAEGAAHLDVPAARALYDAMDALHETFTPEDTAARRVAFEARIGDAALDALTPDRHPDRLSRAHLLAALPTRLGGLATG